MIKRAALARALAPRSRHRLPRRADFGLDPIGAGEFDELMMTLQELLGLTVFMVTHDLDSIYTTCDRGDRARRGQGDRRRPISAMLALEHPWLQSYFHGKREPVRH